VRDPQVFACLADMVAAPVAKGPHGGKRNAGPTSSTTSCRAPGRRTT
jgi:hypothetical protein